MKISQTSKGMIQVIGISAFVFAAAGAIYYRSLALFPFVLGILLGVLLNAWKLVLIERVVTRCVYMEKAAAVNYIRLQYLLRFILTGVALVASAFAPFLNLWGTAAGIFTLQIAAFVAKRAPQEDAIAKIEETV